LESNISVKNNGLFNGKGNALNRPSEYLRVWWVSSYSEVFATRSGFVAGTVSARKKIIAQGVFL